LSAIADSTNISTEEALTHYASVYNLQFREQMAKIPALHQDIAKEMYKKIAQGE
jgi:hypothetical protein